MCGGAIDSMSAVAFDKPRHIPPRLVWLLLNAGNYVLVGLQLKGVRQGCKQRHRRDIGRTHAGHKRIHISFDERFHQSMRAQHRACQHSMLARHASTVCEHSMRAQLAKTACEHSMRALPQLSKVVVSKHPCAKSYLLCCSTLPLANRAPPAPQG